MLPILLPHPSPLPEPLVLCTGDQDPARPRAAFYHDIAQLVTDSVSPTRSDESVDDDSRLSPPATSNYHYVKVASASFDSPDSPSEMYENEPHFNYPSNFSASSVSAIRDSDQSLSYSSNSPSPTDANPPSAFSHSLTSSQDRFSPHPYHTDTPNDRFPDPSSRPSYFDKISSGNSSPAPSNLLDYRRMSEPAVLAVANAYTAASADADATYRYQQQYPSGYTPQTRSTFTPHLQRGNSIGSLRDLRHQHLQYPSSHSQTDRSDWKSNEDSHRDPAFHGSRGTGAGIDPPLSPYQPNLSGTPTVGGGLQYSPIAEDPYGPSPPGTGTSTSSNAIIRTPSHSLTNPGLPRIGKAGDEGPGDCNNLTRSPDSASSKTYSFVALPGNAMKKRPRRRYDEIERLYQCSFPECNKAYGTLNHLNAHVTMQKHGSKRSPNEFKELRKQWRKAKKESESGSLGPHSPQSPAFGMGMGMYSGRRGSLGNIALRHDEQDQYDDHMSYGQQQRYPFPSGPSLNLPSTASSMYGNKGRFNNVPIDDLRYHSGNGVDREGDNAMDYPQSNSPWPHPAGVTMMSSMSSTRSSLHHHQQQGHSYISSSLPSLPSPLSTSHHSHHQPHHSLHNLDTSSASHHHSHVSQLPPSHPSPTAHHHHPSGLPFPLTRSQSPPHMPLSRLPPNSTLLTPLPGYEPPTSQSLGMHPSLSGDAYDQASMHSGEGAGYYEEDVGRSTSGSRHMHGSSGDDY